MMRVYDYIKNRDIIYPTVIAKLLLADEVIRNIHERFENRTEPWEKRDNDDGREDKRTNVFNSVIEKDRCIELINWGVSESVRGPYLLNNEIVFFKDDILLVFHCSPYVVSDGIIHISDMWVRKITPFMYGTKFVLPEVDKQLDFKVMKNIEEWAFPVSKFDYFLKVCLVYGVHQWTLQKKKSRGAS